MTVPDSPGRLKSLVPAGWLTRSGSLWPAVRGGLADTIDWIGSRAAYAKAQTRAATTSGFWLDILAWDFFGSRFMRRRGEVDDAFRPRIRREVFRPRATRGAMVQALTDLTGYTPELYEPWNPSDCGASDVGTLAYAGDPGVSAILFAYDQGTGGYDSGQGYAQDQATAALAASAGAGCYGSYELPNQVFVRVRRGAPKIPHAEGAAYFDAPTTAYAGGAGGDPDFAGYDAPIAGSDLGPAAYLDPAAMYGSFRGAGFYASPQDASDVTDEEIYATVAATVAAGVVAWTEIRPV